MRRIMERAPEKVFVEVDRVLSTRVRRRIQAMVEFYILKGYSNEQILEEVLRRVSLTQEQRQWMKENGIRMIGRIRAHLVGGPVV